MCSVMNIGYARVSTNDQTLDLQFDALQAADCAQIFRDTMSGAKADRPGLSNALTHLRAGDVLVVWRLDRLGRSLKHLIDTVNELHEQSVGFKSLTENIDTTTPTGKLVFHFFGALAEFERDLIRERTLAGLQAARARGRHGGRPRALTNAAKITMARKLHADKTNSIADVCNTLSISRATLYRYLKTSQNEA